MKTAILLGISIIGFGYIQAQPAKPDTKTGWDSYFNSSEKEKDKLKKENDNLRIKVGILTNGKEQSEKNVSYLVTNQNSLNGKNKELENKLKELENKLKNPTRNPFSLGVALTYFWYNYDKYRLEGNSNATPNSDTVRAVGVNGVLMIKPFKNIKVIENLQIVLSVPLTSLNLGGNFTIGGKAGPFNFGIAYIFEKFNRIGLIATLGVKEKVALEEKIQKSELFAISKYGNRLVVGDNIPEEVLAIHGKNKLFLYPHVGIVIPFSAFKQ